MRRLPKSLLRAAFSRPVPHHCSPLPPLHPPPPRPRFLPFSTQTLTPGISPDAAPPAAKPAGLAFLEEAEALEPAGDHKRTIDLVLKAVVPLQESHGGWSLPVARALRLAGAAASRAGRVSDGIESLGAASEIVDYIWGMRHGDREVAAVGAAVYEQLARTKMTAGRRWDAVGDLQRALEMKAVFLDAGNAELGDTCRDVAEAYTNVLEFDKALPLCLKALGIAEGRSGEDSTEVAKVQRVLAVVYTGLDRNGEALQQIELARILFERLVLDVELSQVEIDAANLHLLLGKSEEAMNYVKRVMQRSDKESEERALAYVTMAKLLSFQDRTEDSKRCLEIARGIIDAKDSMNRERLAEAYAEISMLYESMTEFETSLTLMKKTLELLEGASETQHIAGSISARMGWLLLLTKRVSEAVPYLESAVDKLKNCFGPKHFGLGFAYKHLGQAYVEMDQHESAVKFLALAKDIIVATFGPTHEDSIDISQSLANAYGLLGR
jgi:tetratricopeptide (TPR) repeat protein